MRMMIEIRMIIRIGSRSRKEEAGEESAKRRERPLKLVTLYSV